MTFVRRTTQLVGTAALGAVAALLIFEVTDVIGGEWRRRLATAIGNVAFPDWPLWASGLVGAALGVLGLILVVAQFAPPRKGLNSMHEVYKGPTGETRIRGRAAIRAACHELNQIDGVVDTTGRVEKSTLHVELHVDERSNLAAVEAEARQRLGHEFWINLGLADFSVNLLVSHHTKPPRVR